MKKIRHTKLSLRRETVRTLSDNLLAHAVGGKFDKSNNVCPPQTGDSANGSCPCGGSAECYTASCTF